MFGVVLQYLCYIIDKNIEDITLFQPGSKAAFPRLFPTLCEGSELVQIHFTHSVPYPLLICCAVAQLAPEIHITPVQMSL